MPLPPNTNIPDLSPTLPVTTDSAEETRALGADLVPRLPSRAIVALYGELGAGKTQLVKGIAQGLGIPSATVRSPTFTILHTYDTGSRPLYHFDAYRVQDPDEFVELGFEDYVYGTTSDEPGPITCIEWAEHVEAVLPPSTIRLHFRHVGPTRRRITVGSSEAPPADDA